MIFNAGSSPYKATYTGDNIEFGHVIVAINKSAINMLYHAQTKDGELVAGTALVSLIEDDANRLKMTLNWQWLTGDLSSGTSYWKEIVA